MSRPIARCFPSLVVLCAACASPHMAVPPGVDAMPSHDASAPALDGSITDAIDGAVPTDATAIVDAATPAPDATIFDGSPACGAVGQPCCAGVCMAGAYCYMSACVARPTIQVLEPDGNVLGVVCADLSRAHVNPNYFVRIVIHGRANGISYRYYKKTSCGNTVAQLVPDGMQALDGNGSYVFTIENATGDPSCTNGNIGVYEEWAVVDGVESDHAFGRVYASGCAMYSTCGAVSGACP